MRIRTISIIGLGALGTIYADHFSRKLPKDDVRIIADRKRIDRYEKSRICCNGRICEFNYVPPDAMIGPADLAMFSVKFNDLNQAVADAKNQIGPTSIILSVLNGVTSEQVIGGAYGMDKLVYCVAQGMDPVKKDNELTYHNMGVICFGAMHGGDGEKIAALADFFDRAALPYELVDDMKRKLWSKFMLNCGVNQTAAVFETKYGGIQAAGEARDVMIASMREVLQIAAKEGIDLAEADISYWLGVLDKLHPSGRPSMRQDVEAKRLSEVDVFSGAVMTLGKNHGIPTPINDFFYKKIKEMESRYPKSWE